jgi:hypothetical protein
VKWGFQLKEMMETPLPLINDFVMEINKYYKKQEDSNRADNSGSSDPKGAWNLPTQPRH